MPKKKLGCRANQAGIYCGRDLESPDSDRCPEHSWSKIISRKQVTALLNHLADGLDKLAAAKRMIDLSQMKRRRLKVRIVED